jgi:fibronectin-binding autotransporter adhesin
MKILLFICISTSLLADSFTWTGATNQEWGNASNWTPAVVPNAVGATAIFPATFTNQPSGGSGTFIIGTLQFNSTPTPITLASGNTLNFSALSGNASMTATTPGHQIESQITLTSPLVTNIGQNASVTLSGVISGSNSFSVGGIGTTALTGSNTFLGNVIVSSGTLQINSDSALGAAANSVTLSGTLQITTTLSSTRKVSLGTATFDTGIETLTLNGVISGNSFTKIGSGTLALTGANTYSGGTTVSQGILKISADQNLGASTSSLFLTNNTTLQAGASFALSASRAIAVNGSVTINTGAFSPVIAGNISGGGSLSILGTQLTLSGTNTYSGPTSVSGATLIGNTSSLQGAIQVSNSGSVIFHQTGSGTFGGSYSGNVGTTLQLEGGGVYTFTGDNSTSLSTTNLVNAHLIVTGSLGSNAFNIDNHSILSGQGTLHTVLGITNSGKISPGGSSPSTLFVNGKVSFTPGSGTLVSIIEPVANDLLQVSETATLTDGLLSLQYDPNLFYPLTNTYTLIKAGSVVGTFGTIVNSHSQFIPTILYTPTSVELFVQNLRPFSNFPFGNSNERAVGHYLDALSTASLLNADLIALIDSLGGEPFSEVSLALDQLHPAQMSAIAELQTTLGGQFLNRLHKRAGFAWGCFSETSFFWIEPFGNWLHEKRLGMQTGFQATTRGISVGLDQQFFDCWTLGIAGAYQITDLNWARHRGYAYIRGAYGAIYSDITAGRFYLGSSAYFGKDWNHVVRKIQFTTIDRQAKSKASAYDVGGQLTTAYFFGTRSFHLYPYGTIDFLYLKNDSFSERGASSLNLDVQVYRSSTLRAESGLSLRFVDRNDDESICISPLLSMGYVLELPLHRDHFRAHFTGMPINFRTQGWDRAWQLLNLRTGLTLTYRCLSLDAQYIADLSPDGDHPYVNQRANFKFGVQF